MTSLTEDNGSVAQRVAQARKLAGLTQKELADRSNLSVGIIRSVEQKRVPATPAFLGAVSKALRVGVADLNGQPYPPAPGADTEVHKAVGVFRTELAAYDIDSTDIVETRPLAQLTVNRHE